MLSETVAYRQWRIFLQIDALAFVLPVVMAGLAAGAVAFHLIKRQKEPAGNTLTWQFSAYAALSPATFLFLPLSTRSQPPATTLFLAAAVISGFFLLAAWGYINTALFDRCRSSIFNLYGVTLLGTIAGVCAAIFLMDSSGIPFAIMCCIAAALTTALIWILPNPSIGGKIRCTAASIFLLGGVAVFTLPPAILSMFGDREPPAWFGSNSFSQLEMHPIEPFSILRTPARGAVIPRTADVQAWRVYFDRLHSYQTGIVRYTSLEKARFLQHDLSSLAFQLDSSGRALILGAGGGIEVIQGLLAGWREIEAVDINPLVLDAVRHAGAADFLTAPGVKYLIADARRFLLRPLEPYRLIFLPNVVSGQGVTGIINAQYLNTVEMTDRYLEKITPEGALVFRSHRNDWPALLATIKAVLQNRPDGKNWSIFLASKEQRKKAFGLIILHRGSFSAERKRSIDEFITSGGFSWQQIDLRQVEETPVLTDDHPYAVNSPSLQGEAKADSLFRLLHTDTAPIMVRFLIPLSAAFLLIISLLAFQAKSARPEDRGLLLAGGGYFASLGSGFLAAEIIVTEKTFQMVGNPTIAFGVTVCSLLGGTVAVVWLSRATDSRRFARLMPKAAIAAAIILPATYYLLGLPLFFSFPSDWARLLYAGCVIFAAGAVTGMLFPAGLRLLAEAERDSIPWSWAVNGIAAAVGGIGAELLAILFGYQAALFFAAGCYGMAAACSFRIAGLWCGRPEFFKKNS